MFGKKSSSQGSMRARQPTRTINESFRRNNVVVSRRQKEIAQHQQSVTQRQLERKRQLARRRNHRRIAAAVMLVVLGAVLYRSSVSTIKLESNASSRLQSAQQTEYEQAILSLYKEHTILGQSWLADQGTIITEVKKRFPEIEHLTFNSKLISGSIIGEVRFRKPAFTWRDASDVPQFVDQNGVLFARNLDPAVNTSKLIAIEDQSGVVLEAGKTVLTENLIQFVGQLYGKLPAIYGKESRVGRVIVPKSTREVQVQIEGQPYVIKFNTTRNLEEQVGELNALLGHLKANNITPAAYIDLRVAHKAFYK